MELKLSMDRIRCIADELKSISESDKFIGVELKITEFDLHITPIAKTVHIVIKRPGEVDGK